MTNYKPWDIVALPFPYVEGKKGKVRPALLVSKKHSSNTFLVVMITSKKNKELIAGDVVIENGKKCGVLVESIIRTSRMATLDERMIIKKVGSIKVKKQNNVYSQIQLNLAKPISNR